MSVMMNNAEYFQTLSDIRQKIKTAQHKAVFAANGELIALYWNIGSTINERSSWGSKFVENLARDIKLDMPNATGYSVRNLKYMAKFAKLFPDFEIVQAALAQITWYHNIANLLLELGTGFAFVGNQYHIEVEKKDFYIDLLFYNLKLRCYVVIELKSGDFKPEYAGKLNFYISAVDDLMKTAQDNPTIGILLCKNKNGMIAEYALRDIEKPIGVSEYNLFDTLPKEYENVLPSAEDIERRISVSE